MKRCIGLKCGQCDFHQDFYLEPGEEGNESCPNCRGSLQIDWATLRFGLSARGPGVSSTKIGRRKAKALEERSSRLAKTQWDNFAPAPVPEGTRVRNPTPGGPYDPNSKFNRKPSLGG